MRGSLLQTAAIAAMQTVIEHKCRATDTKNRDNDPIDGTDRKPPILARAIVVGRLPVHGLASDDLARVAGIA